MGIHQVIEVIYKFVATLAIILGGIWTYFHYFRGRTYKRRLEPAVLGSCFIRDNVVYLRVEIKVKNVGLSKADISHQGSILSISSYDALDSIPEPYRSIEEEISHYQILEKHKRIEPYEMVDDHFLIALPYEDQLGFRIDLTIVSNGHEWNTSDIVPLLQTKGVEPKTLTKGG